MFWQREPGEPSIKYGHSLDWFQVCQEQSGRQEVKIAATQKTELKTYKMKASAWKRYTMSSIGCLQCCINPARPAFTPCIHQSGLAAHDPSALFNLWAPFQWHLSGQVDPNQTHQGLTLVFVFILLIYLNWWENSLHLPNKFQEPWWSNNYCSSLHLFSQSVSPTSHTCISFTCNQPLYLGHRFTPARCQTVLCDMHDSPAFHSYLITWCWPSRSLTRLCLLTPKPNLLSGPTTMFCLTSLCYSSTIKTVIKLEIVWHWSLCPECVTTRLYLIWKYWN